MVQPDEAQTGGLAGRLAGGSAGTVHPWIRRGALAGVIVLFVAAIWALYRSGPAATVGQPAPAFSLPTPSGGHVDLAAYRGRVVLLNFFTTWCAPCQKEIPGIVAFARAAGSGLQVIGIDRMEPAGTVAAFARGDGMLYPIGLDRSGTLSQTYGVDGQPESFWIDPQGTLRLHVVGPMTPARMQAIYQALRGGG